MRISDWSSDVCSSDLLSAGHLHISEIWPLFEEAKKRGVRRLLVNHPIYVVGAEIEDVRQIVDMGAYVEHSICMFVEGSKFKFYDPETLDALIKAGTLDRTILGSDLGQVEIGRHTSELQSLMRISYAVFCLQNKKYKTLT